MLHSRVDIHIMLLDLHDQQPAVKPHLASAAHPEPSVLAATDENSFLKRSKDPNSLFRASARSSVRLLDGLRGGGGQILPEEVVQSVISYLEGQLL